MTESNRHAQAHAADRVARSLVPAGPYAGPARGSSARARHEDHVPALPYVPAPFRGKPSINAVANDSATLPSIDEFLTTPTQDDDTAQALFATPELDAPTDTTAAGQWPLDEAGAELQRIGDLFETPAVEPSALFDGAFTDDSTTKGGAAKDSKPMWRTDEWMDIMPVSPSGAEQDTPDHQGDEYARRAADALDKIVQRVRRGEITIQGFDESMSDATLLAALLTTMLGRSR
jgi:hypothetical protein